MVESVKDKLQARLGLLEYYSSQTRAHIVWMGTFALILLSAITLKFNLESEGFKGVHPPWYVFGFLSLAFCISVTVILYCIGRTLLYGQLATRVTMVKPLSKTAVKSIMENSTGKMKWSNGKKEYNRFESNLLVKIRHAASEDLNRGNLLSKGLYFFFLRNRRIGIIVCFILGFLSATIIV